MFIGACGFGSTGSSAVTDYLKEFDCNQVFDKLEFTITYCVDGLTDLERHLMFPTGRTAEGSTAIHRFRDMILRKSRYLRQKTKISQKELIDITDEFINSITQLFLVGFQNYRSSFWRHQICGRLLNSKIIPYIEKKTQKEYDGFPREKIPFSVKPDNFYISARIFINKLLNAFGADLVKNVVMDQPFSGINPQACFPFFDNPFAIVVDRDPRDNYIFAKTKLRGVYKFMPTENVHDFIKYYRSLRENQPYKEKNDNVLRVQFEDLVYDYDVETQRIRDKLHLSENKNSKSIFDPSLSIANTQTFRRFPEFLVEVKIIEKELTDYLFDFDKYPIPDLSKEMFYGKSPKNK